MPKHNHCDGCTVKDCDFYKDNFDCSCPCTNCIVKTMCEEDDAGECDNWWNWDIKIDQEGKPSG